MGSSSISDDEKEDDNDGVGGVFGNPGEDEQEVDEGGENFDTPDEVLSLDTPPAPKPKLREEVADGGGRGGGGTDENENEEGQSRDQGQSFPLSLGRDEDA